MFDNIGKKIKNLIKVICAIEIIVFLIIGFVTTMPLIPIVGFFVAWISSFIMYGYGEIIDNSQIQTKQNETIINLLQHYKNADSVDEVVTKKIQGSVIKQVDNSGFSAMTIENAEKEV